MLECIFFLLLVEPIYKVFFLISTKGVIVRISKLVDLLQFHLEIKLKKTTGTCILKKRDTI